MNNQEAIEELRKEIKRIWNANLMHEIEYSYMMGLAYALRILGDTTPFDEIVGEDERSSS